MGAKPAAFRSAEGTENERKSGERKLQALCIDRWKAAENLPFLKRFQPLMMC